MILTHRYFYVIHELVSVLLFWPSYPTIKGYYLMAEPKNELFKYWKSWFSLITFSCIGLLKVI